MNIWDIIILAVIAAIVVWAIVRIRKNRGKNCSCGCGACESGCVEGERKNRTSFLHRDLR